MHFIFKLISPLSVYLIALVSTLLIISFTLDLSPITSYGISSAIFKLKFIFFSPIRVFVILHKFIISSLKLYVVSTISILFASILLISKMLPTISNNVLLAFTMSFEFSITSFGKYSL